MILFKKFEFEMAHCLDGYEGPCNNVHGHSYKLEIGYESNDLLTNGPDEGMLLDFKKFDKTIVETFDHVFIYNNNNKNESEIAKLLLAQNKKVISLPGRTTCENLASYILNYLKTKINPRYKVVRLWETANNYVEVK